MIIHTFCITLCQIRLLLYHMTENSIKYYTFTFEVFSNIIFATVALDVSVPSEDKDM